MKIIRILVFALFSILNFAGEYQVDKAEKNNVKFISATTIQDFDGVTDNIDGFLYYEGDDLLNKSKLYFEVDLTTLDTGIGLRNRHMRENYLETDKYRTTTFSGKLIKADKLTENEYDVVVKGEIFIHGVTKEMTIEGKINRKERKLEIKTGFSIKLSDFDIEIPSFMFLKLSNNIKLELDFFMNAAN